KRCRPQRDLIIVHTPNINTIIEPPTSNSRPTWCRGQGIMPVVEPALDRDKAVHDPMSVDRLPIIACARCKDVRYGSLADIRDRITDVRFAPNSGHSSVH